MALNSFYGSHPSPASECYSQPRIDQNLLPSVPTILTNLAEVWERDAGRMVCLGVSFGRESESGAETPHSRTSRNFRSGAYARRGLVVGNAVCAHGARGATRPTSRYLKLG